VLKAKISTSEISHRTKSITPPSDVKPKDDVVPATSTASASASASAPASAPVTRPKLPWYRQGGLYISMNGMGVNIFGAIIVLASSLPTEQWNQFWAFTLLCILSSTLTCRTLYCILIVPCTMASATLVFQFNNWPTLLALSLALGIWKVNICMSVCLHRYAAHSAFQCGPRTSLALLALGCLANQGGPLWWASVHRCHHTYCDVPRDPHSALLDGKEKAFGFFHFHEGVKEEFVPRYLNKTIIRILDTWCFLLVMAELYLSYSFFGPPGLFVAHTSAWLCQEVTCWFNVVNHPPLEERTCKASNGSASLQKGWYLPFHLLDRCYPIFAIFVMEGEHQDHHENSMLAKRSWYDIAYFGFILPLEKMGLVWNVKCY